MLVLTVRIAAVAVLAGVSQLALAHGPTQCVGMISYTSQTASLDLRLGFGLLHNYLFPDLSKNHEAEIAEAHAHGKKTKLEHEHDTYISQLPEEEWTSVTKQITSLMQEGLVVRSGKTSHKPKELKVERTTGFELRILAEFDLPAADATPRLAIPVLKKLPGQPPAVISVWNKGKMTTPPTMLFFNKDLPLK